MRGEHMKRWLAAARRVTKDETAAGEESTEPMEASNWERVFALVQTVFSEGRLAEDNTWQAVVLILRGE